MTEHYSPAGCSGFKLLRQLVNKSTYIRVKVLFLFSGSFWSSVAQANLKLTQPLSILMIGRHRHAQLCFSFPPSSFFLLCVCLSVSVSVYTYVWKPEDTMDSFHLMLSTMFGGGGGVSFAWSSFGWMSWVYSSGICLSLPFQRRDDKQALPCLALFSFSFFHVFT